MLSATPSVAPAYAPLALRVFFVIQVVQMVHLVKIALRNVIVKMEPRVTQRLVNVNAVKAGRDSSAIVHVATVHLVCIVIKNVYVRMEPRVVL